MITPNLAFVVLLNKTPMELFASGGFVMWPILLVFTVGLTVIIERLLFIIRENGQREPEVVAKMLENVEKGDVEGALALGKKSEDTVARILVYSLTHLRLPLERLLPGLRPGTRALPAGHGDPRHLHHGRPAARPLGTVTGMMRTFGALGSAGSDSARRPARSRAVSPRP